jgi:hypothetical protein
MLADWLGVHRGQTSLVATIWMCRPPRAVSLPTTAPVYTGNLRPPRHRMAGVKRGHFSPMSMDVHFLAGSWHRGANGCLRMLSDVTLDVRKPA